MLPKFYSISLTKLLYSNLLFHKCIVYLDGDNLEIEFQKYDNKIELLRQSNFHKRFFIFYVTFLGLLMSNESL